MKIQFESTTLETILKEVNKIVPNNATRQSLKHVLISASAERVDFYTSGEAVSLRRTLFQTVAESPVTIEEEGRCLLPAKELLEMVKKAVGTVTLAMKSSTEAKISFGKTKYAVNGLDPDVFVPYTNDESESSTVVIVAAALRNTLRRTRYAASKNHARPILTAVNLKANEKGLTTEATDGLVLSRHSADGQLEGDDRSLPVEANLIDYLVSLLPSDDDEKVRLQIGSAALVASWDDDSVRLAIRGLAETYPNVDQILREPQLTIQVDRAQLLSACERTFIILGDSPKAKISMGETIRLYATSEAGTAGDEIPIEGGTAPDFPMLVNPKYFIDAMKALEGMETVELGFVGQNNPIIVKPVDGEGIGLISPLQYHEIEENPSTAKSGQTA